MTDQTPDAPESELAQTVKNVIHSEMSNFLSDIEFRLAHVREIEGRIMAVAEQQQQPMEIGPSGEALVRTLPTRRVYAEDLNLGVHQITGYTVTANSPGAGSIAWASVHVVYNGVDYTCADGNTANKYVWFVKPGSGTSVTLNSSNTKPTSLGPADALLFVNNAGTPISVLETSIPPVIGDSAVDTNAIADGAVTSTKTNFYTTLSTAITNAQSAADLAQATADGSITTYFQSAAPWADGSSQPAAKVGDIWYDSDDGQAYRWSGAGGSPVNTWVAITDTDITTALANAAAAQTTANSKITTFYAASGSPPSAISVGDLWIVTDQGNQLRRATATGTGSWVTVQVSGAAIATGGVTDTHLASGINGTKISAGTIGSTQVGTGAVTPTKLATLQHILY